MVEMKKQTRHWPMALVSLVLALSTCSSAPSSSVKEGKERPTIAGRKAYGPFVGLERLGATAWDGQRVWLTEEGGRLLAVDGGSGEVVIDRQLDSLISDSGNMVHADEELWATGRDKKNLDVQVLRINTGTGGVNAKTPDRGRPLGQALRRGETLIVADYDRRIVSVDPQTGATRVLVELDIAPNFLQFAPGDTYWVVDDDRARLLRFDPNGKRMVESPRTRYVAGLVADETGNAWLAEQTAVAAVNPAGETIRELSGLKNATTVLACDGAVIASDVETGQLAWLDGAGRDQRVETGTSGRAIACAPSGVWFVSADGYLTRVTTPNR
jgi:sugar lactone lactonase YvrE